MSSKRSPIRGRFFDETTEPNGAPQVESAPPSTVQSGVSEANYRLLVQQLVLCNEEIERLQVVEKRLLAENAKLKQSISEFQVSSQLPATPPKDVYAYHSPAKFPTDDVTPKEEGSAAAAAPTLRPYLGVEVMDTGSEVVVKNILPGGGADDAGVQVNDIILRWNGRPVSSRQEFGLLVSQSEVGSIVKLQVERGPKKQILLLRVEVKGTTGVKTPAKGPRQYRTPQSNQGSNRKPSATSDLDRLNVALN
eukprot:GGOE01054113.1.p1 GENE.GGOE01054113.1~~GGOE01054113.1.p1  ORF type:complete len:260 (-),score=44.10 GGOE01054113.1:195-944(-)